LTWLARSAHDARQRELETAEQSNAALLPLRLVTLTTIDDRR
jgi:hypothetical protein